MTIALRPYQDETLDAVDAALGRGVRRQLVVLPTGTGKTVCFSKLLERRGGTALILAHRDELLRQAADKIRTVAPELAMSIGFVQADRDDVGAPIVIASVQTLARPSRLARLPQHFTTKITDEAHHATASTYRKIDEHVDADVHVGFTATAERSDRSLLVPEVFDEIVYARSLLEMIDAGYLCNLRGVRVELAELDLSKVRTSRGDYQANDLGRALHAAHAPEQTAAAMVEHARDRKSIVFVPTVELAGETARAIDQAGITCAHVWGDMPTEDRRRTLAELSSGRLQCVVNVDVLTEGYDEPSIDCVVIAAPTKARVPYVQRVGRGTRLHPGKDDCLVLDLVGVTNDLKLQSVPALFGLRRPLRMGETVTDAVAREQTEKDEHDKRTAAKLRRRHARRADLFDRRRLHWLTIGDRWVIGLGEGHYLTLDPTGDRSWRVLLIRPAPLGARILASGLDLGYAQGAAEETVRANGKQYLVDTKAAWRRKPISAGQRGKLRAMGIRTPAEMTKGEAADLITEALAAERLARLDAALAARAAAAA
ncbi:MAG TPA: DEAD/DEAH box helicase [Gaiellaceae bacterium]|nr:DEAD/DEAH box helicase [Gaiellaceae bacterium]